jgi:hypothetical protein
MDVIVERSTAPQSSRMVSVEVLNRGRDKKIIGAVSWRLLARREKPLFVRGWPRWRVAALGLSWGLP